MDWIDDESLGLVCPGFADELVGCEALEGLQAPGEVVGGDEFGDPAVTEPKVRFRARIAMTY